MATEANQGIEIDEATETAGDILPGTVPAQGLIDHTASVISVGWSADGRLASGSSDGTVIVWDIETGEAAQTLTGHTSSVRSVGWSADGRLASSSDDGTVIVVQEAFTHPPCNWLLRNLTEGEWIQYKNLFDQTFSLPGEWNLILIPPYRPTCPNLPAPDVHFLLTWPGKLAVGGGLVLGLVLLVVFIIVLRRLTRFLRERVRRRGEKVMGLF
jgi:WD40 repeat protein